MQIKLDTSFIKGKYKKRNTDNKTIKINFKIDLLIRKNTIIEVIKRINDKFDSSPNNILRWTDGFMKFINNSKIPKIKYTDKEVSILGMFIDLDFVRGGIKSLIR